MQNPTGTDLSAAVMYRVLRASEEFDFKIVEDDTYCDLARLTRAVRQHDLLGCGPA